MTVSMADERSIGLFNGGMDVFCVIVELLYLGFEVIDNVLMVLKLFF